MSASLSALGHAQSSPMVSGVIDWKAVDEPLQPLRIEAAGAATDELERHRVDARRAGELVGGDDWKAPVERARQIVPDVARRRRNQVEVVEQPFGCRRPLLAKPGVIGQRDVDLSQRAHVRVETVQVRG